MNVTVDELRSYYDALSGMNGPLTSQTTAVSGTRAGVSWTTCKA